MKSKLLIEKDNRIWQLRNFDFDKNKGALEPIVLAFIKTPPQVPKDHRPGETLAPVRVLLSVKEQSDIIGVLPKTIGYLEFYFDYVGDSEKEDTKTPADTKLIQ